MCVCVIEDNYSSIEMERFPPKFMRNSLCERYQGGDLITLARGIMLADLESHKGANEDK